MNKDLTEIIARGIFEHWGKADFNCYFHDEEAMIWRIMDQYELDRNMALSITRAIHRLFPSGKK